MLVIVFVGCCLLFVVCCLVLSVVCYLSCVVVGCWFFVAGCFVVCWLLLLFDACSYVCIVVVRWSLFGVRRCASFVVCREFFVVVDCCAL